MVVVPAMLAVGNGVTVITALPVMPGSGAATVHDAPFVETLTIVYVVFVVGLTETVAPLAIPVDVKFVVPSV